MITCKYNLVILSIGCRVQMLHYSLNTILSRVSWKLVAQQCIVYTLINYCTDSVLSHSFVSIHNVIGTQLITLQDLRQQQHQSTKCCHKQVTLRSASVYLPSGIIIL